MKKNKLFIALAVGILVLPTLQLNAEEDRVPPPGASTRPAPTNNFRPDREPLKPGMKASIRKELDRPLIEGEKPLQKRVMVDRPIVEGQVEGEVKVSVEQRKINLDKRIVEMKANRAKIEATADARKKEITKKIQEKKGEVKIKLETKKKENVKKLLEVIFARLNNQIERLTKLNTRIGERIATLEENGTDVTVISAQYVKAQTALEKAKVDVKATSTISTEQTDKETSKEALRSLVKTAEDSIKAAGEEYRKVIPLLPEMPKSTIETKVETTTPVTTTSTTGDVAVPTTADTQ